MKPPVAVQVGSAAPAALGCLLVTLLGSPALAQTTDAAAPKPDVAASTAKQQPPPGGCMPIGVTVSGQIVFAFQCKDFIEQQKAADQDPAAAGEDKPARRGDTGRRAGETCARGGEASRGGRRRRRQGNGMVLCRENGELPRLGRPLQLPKHAERDIGPRGCSHFRSTLRHPTPTCPLMDSAIHAVRWLVS